MKIFYSRSTSGFYRDDVNTSIPDDAVEISQDQYNALMTDQAEGQVISADADGNPVAAFPVQTLAAAQADQIAIIDAAYEAAVQVSVSFKTAAGVVQTYQADNQGPLSSQSVLLKTFTGYNIAGATPTGFYWQAEDNTQVPFTLTDLGGLYGAMLGQGNTAFNQRATLKAAIRAAKTIAAVQAITWS